MLCILMLTTPTLFAKVDDMKSTDAMEQISCPAQAFWIKNHWPNSNDAAQLDPPQWRSAPAALNSLLQINKKGLDTLFISGSAAPTLEQMIWIKKTVGEKHPVYIIDLRQETHLYLNGLPISLFYKRDEINWGKTPKEITDKEQLWMKHFLKSGVVNINKSGKAQGGFKVPTENVIVPIKELYPEDHAAKKAGLGYFRIEVPDYHPPTPAQVDQFLAIIKKIPSNAWLHFHCAGGKGRTTTFMAMRDILANAQDVTLEDIITRQAKIGGIDLLGESSSLAEQPWKKEYHKARTYYIRLFYTYVHSGAYPRETFTSWIAKQSHSSYKSILKTPAYCTK